MAESQNMPRIPFYNLVASGVDLSSTFKSAVDAFNARDLTTLMSLCDEGVVVVAIRRQDYHCGKPAVSAYFADQFRLNKSTFTPTTISTTVYPAGTVGHIIGSGEWTEYDPDDPQGAHIDDTIRYAFNFVFRGKGWLISTLWGSPDDLDHRP